MWRWVYRFIGYTTQSYGLLFPKAILALALPGLIDNRQSTHRIIVSNDKRSISGIYNMIMIKMHFLVKNIFRLFYLPPSPLSVHRHACLFWLRTRSILLFFLLLIITKRFVYFHVVACNCLVRHYQLLILIIFYDRIINCSILLLWYCLGIS